MNTITLKPAAIGTVSSGTLRTVDLFPRFVTELEYQIQRNGAFLACPENFPMRDRLNNLLGECQDQYNEDGETLKDEDAADELVQELTEALQEFAPPYCVFGAHLGDGADFGFWPDWFVIDELPAYKDSSEAMADGEVGDFRVVNDHGNTTIYDCKGSVIAAFV